MEEENNLQSDPCINLTLGRMPGSNFPFFLGSLSVPPWNRLISLKQRLVSETSTNSPSSQSGYDIFECYLLPISLAGNMDLYFLKHQRLSYLREGEVPVGHSFLWKKDRHTHMIIVFQNALNLYVSSFAYNTARSCMFLTFFHDISTQCKD